VNLLNLGLSSKLATREILDLDSIKKTQFSTNSMLKYEIKKNINFKKLAKVKKKKRKKLEDKIVRRKKIKKLS
jgi:hypothetical protein